MTRKTTPVPASTHAKALRTITTLERDVDDLRAALAAAEAVAGRWREKLNQFALDTIDLSEYTREVERLTVDVAREGAERLARERIDLAFVGLQLKRANGSANVANGTKEEGR